MYFDNPIIKDKYLKANPELKGRRAMEIFDIVVEEITKAGIMIVMNNHISSSMWCCSTSDG
jgi:endoglucanase